MSAAYSAEDVRPADDILSEVEESDDEIFPMRRARRRPAAIIALDDEDEDEDDAPMEDVEAKAPHRPRRPRPAAIIALDGDDEDDVPMMVEGEAKVPPRRRVLDLTGDSSSDDDSSDDDFSSDEEEEDKKAYDELYRGYTSLTSENNDLKVAIQQHEEQQRIFEAERASLMSAAATTKAKLQRLRQELKEANDERAADAVARADAEKDLADLQDELNKYKEDAEQEIEQLQQDLKAAKRKAAHVEKAAPVKRTSKRQRRAPNRLDM